MVSQSRHNSAFCVVFTIAKYRKMSDLADFYAYVDAHKSTWVDRLSEAVAIKSISAEAAMRPEVIRMMHWTKAWVEKLGGTATLNEIGEQRMPSGETVPLPPILTGQIGSDPAKRTVVLYGHLGE
jgi:nonspecific dipeptidase